MKTDENKGTISGEIRKIVESYSTNTTPPMRCTIYDIKSENIVSVKLNKNGAILNNVFVLGKPKIKDEAVVIFDEGKNEKPLVLCFDILEQLNISYTQTLPPTSEGAYKIGEINIDDEITEIYGKDINTTYEEVTEDDSGLMSSDDKIKLDGIEENANKYKHPTTKVCEYEYVHPKTKVCTYEVDISGKVDKIDGKGLSTNDYTNDDKVKLGNIQPYANNYSHPTTKQCTDWNPSIPNPATSAPPKDSVSGSAGTMTLYARSNHSHPKSDIYAEASHQHTRSDITDFSNHNHDDRYYTKSEIFNEVYPVGSIYISVSDTSPATLFGGTWTRIEGQFLLASGTTPNTSKTYNVGTTGGSKDAIVVDHWHHINAGYQTDGAGQDRIWYNQITQGATDHGIGNVGNFIRNTGESGTDKNMPPYLTVNMWKRETLA